MEVTSTGIVWFEFLLDRRLLVRHLNEEKPDPSAISLLTQFVVNAEKVTQLDSTDIEKCEDETAFANFDFNAKSNRIRKYRCLKMMIMQTVSFLKWDMELLPKLPILEQHSLMKYILMTAKEAEGAKGNQKEFLQALYHRWVIRVILNNTFLKPIKSIYFITLQAESEANEAVMKQLDVQESLNYLESLVVSSEETSPILVPTTDTFAGEFDPDWTSGEEISRATFNSMIHIDLGIYLLNKGQLKESVIHFKQEKIPIENFPYFKISLEELNGYKRAVGLLTSFDQKIEDRKFKSSLNHGEILEITNCMETVDLKRIYEIFNLVPQLPGVVNRMEILPGKWKDHQLLSKDLRGVDEKLLVHEMEKRLIETSNMDELKDVLMHLHNYNTGRSFSKLFANWEIPIPVQHATLKIPFGPFQDFIYIIVVKSKQYFVAKLYSVAKKTLLVAKSELEVQLQTATSTTMNPYLYNLSKLAKMLEWEVLLIEMTEMLENLESFIQNSSNVAELVMGGKDCLRCLQNQTSDVNPRSDIVENVLIGLINLGEFLFVINFEQNLGQRWPFVEFLGLLARVCQDLTERKDVSANYRELWSAVIPVFSTGNVGKGKGAKSPMLSNRAELMWVIERSRSHLLISINLSLLARLHNHILDDVSLQIHAEYLHIWPNILDEVTSEGISKGRSGTKLNSRYIRDFLIRLLDQSMTMSKTSEISWLMHLGDVHLASGNQGLALKCYIEYLAICTDFFEKQNSSYWNDNLLFRRMIKCCELLKAFTQAVILCQFLTEVDYSMAFGMAQEKVSFDASDSLYGFIWDLTILEFIINLHSKRNEIQKRQQATKIMGLLELNANNNEEIKREAMYLRKSQFMRTLAQMYIFV